MTERLALLIEGWRFLPHSYGLFNQWQMLELLRRPGIDLYMRDAPLLKPHWKQMRGLMTPEQESAIARLAEAPPEGDLAATLRAFIPARLDPAARGRTLVYCTADAAWLPRVLIEGGRSLKESHAGTDVVILTPSAWSKWGLLRCGADPDRIAIAPHGVATELFRPAEAEERHRLRQGAGWGEEFVFLNVAAMTLSKGTDLMLKAFARVALRHGHVRLWLKGTEDLYPSAETVKALWQDALTPAEREACRPRLRYLGSSLPAWRLADMYRAADAYVSPYRTESFNQPVLEAAASGLPLICTAGGPTDEFTTREFARYVSARLVPFGREPESLGLEPDLDDLTEAMIEAVESPALATRARAAGPSHARSAHTWRHAVDTLLRVAAP
jgi:glycosyltransferase involved in cell wall biosynthesis